MKIAIATSQIQTTYVDGANNITSEPRVTLDNWLISGRIKPLVPAVVNEIAYYQDGDSPYQVDRESLLDIFPGGDGIISDVVMVWQADKAIFDLPMPETILSSRIPTIGGDSVFPNINKFTSTGVEVKTVGEWLDSLCEVWENDSLGEVQIHANPINNKFLQFHLVRAFVLEFTMANYPVLSKNTEYITLDVAVTRRAASGWLKLQP